MYELGFYIPEDGILHSHRRQNLKSYIRGYLSRLFSDTLSSSGCVALNVVAMAGTELEMTWKEAVIASFKD
jgi:hypothetical protein